MPTDCRREGTGQRDREASSPADGHRSHLLAVEEAFVADIDYGMLVSVAEVAHAAAYAAGLFRRNGMRAAGRIICHKTATKMP
jgi:hypothetical protein